MANDMTLLWGAGSVPCWRVMIALEEKNLQGYNQKRLSFENGEHKSKDVMDINPRGQLPTFKHEDNIVNESYAACMYLEAERHDSALQRNKEILATEVKLWEGYLQKMETGSFLAGNAISLADVVVFPTIAFLFHYGLSVVRYPQLAQYNAMMKDRPSVKATVPPDWLEEPQGTDTLKDL